ncbi:MAG: transcriptional repressor [Candidatus Kaistia colombiensis]|nr:MAG: transcriptional repressor [Kaistia sp.]
MTSGAKHGTDEIMLEHRDHDHDHCARDAIAHAEAISAAEGLRFTEQRRKVLAALAESHVPASAYDVIDRLAADGPRPAPVSVYRALEFLVEHGFAHRIESRNAYIACSRGSEGHDKPGHGAATVFLLCENCGAAGEASSAALTEALAAVTQAAGFAPSAPIIEIRGLCARCRKAG